MRRLTCQCTDFAWIMSPGLLQLVLVMLAWKIAHFWPTMDQKGLALLSVLAKSAQGKYHSSSWNVFFSVIMRSILIIFFPSSIHVRSTWYHQYQIESKHHWWARDDFVSVSISLAHLVPYSISKLWSDPFFLVVCYRGQKCTWCLLSELSPFWEPIFYQFWHIWYPSS